jgi:hypothetical protein
MFATNQAGKFGYSWLILIGLTCLALLSTGCQTFVLDTDVVQARFDAATPPVDGSHTLVQSFLCQHPNLCEIELLPAVYETAGEGTLTWRLISPEDNRELIAQSISVADIRPNIPLRLTFPPQPDSAGRTYALSLEGTPGVRVGLWRSTLNAYGSGELQVDASADPGDLRFTTRCRYDVPLMFSQLGASFLPHLGLLIPLAALLLLPGYVLRHSLALRPVSAGVDLMQGDDPMATLALNMALSLALIPVALLWSTVLGLHWQRTLCQVTFWLLAMVALARLTRTRGSDLALWMAARYRWLVLAMVAVLGASWLLRLAQIRNLVLPAWVDSPQHVLVTELVTLYGQVPRSYEPLLPVTTFSYHFGFHADTAVFAWLSGLPIPAAMLILGQVLNGACALTAYLLTVRLTRRKMAGVAAAGVVGLVSYLPAYYVSWGRYTQLTGMLLLPAALVTALEWLEGEERDYRWLFSAALMQAGLFLTHARVSILGACFLLVYLLFMCVAHLRRGDRRENRELWWRSGLLALLGVCLSGPWLVQLITAMIGALRAAGSRLSGDPSYNAVPFELLFIARNRELMAVGALGAIAGLLQRRRESALILLWCLAVVLVVNPGWLGLPSTELMNNATAVIALFLPLSVLNGQAVTFIWDHVPLALDRVAGRLRSGWHVAAAARVALALLLMVMALWSAWRMVSIINPDTILATAEDLTAMTWIRENTPPDALFLINTRHWQLGVYTGTDGGYWIPLLTGRHTLLPVLAYDYGRPEYVQHITALAQIVSETEDVDEAQFQAILEQERVAYVYIGAKGGPLVPTMFVDHPRYRPVYNSGEVWIFEVVR